MTYLVFKNTKFVGHTKNKKNLKRFLKERKGDYIVQEIEEELFGPALKGDEDFYLKEIDFYSEYDIVMTEEELINVYSIIRDRLREILLLKKEIRDELKYVKLKGEENLVMSQFFEFIEFIEDDLDMEYESSVFLNDYFDVKTVINILIRKWKQ
jgi:hypothetical protein